MAELADAQASGACGSNIVRVQVPLPALFFKVDAVMFGRNINPVSFPYCGLLTIGFSMIVNLFMHQKLKKIDMVESLKSVE